MKLIFMLENKEITSIDVISTPFSVGDIVNLDVERLETSELTAWKESHQKKIMDENLELLILYRNRAVQIVKEIKEISFKQKKEGRVTITYICSYF